MSMDGTPIQNNGSHKASFSLSGVTGNKAQTLGTFLNRKVTALPGEKVSRVIIPINDTPSITIRDTMGKPQTLKNLKERKIEKLDDSKTENRQRYQTLQLSLKYGQFTALSLEATPVKGGKEQELLVTLNLNEQLEKLKDSQLETLTTPPPGGKGYTLKEANFLASKGMDWAAECFHESPEQLANKFTTWIENAPNRTDNPAIQKRFSRSDSGYSGSPRSDHEIERPQSTLHTPDSFLSEERKARIEDWVENIVPPDPGELPMGGPDAVRSENKVPEDDKGPFASGSAGSRPSQHADIFEEDEDDVLSQLFSEDGQEAILDEAKGVDQEDSDSGIGSGDDHYQKGINDEGGEPTEADRKAADNQDEMEDWEADSHFSEDSELFQINTGDTDNDFTLEETRRKEGGQTSPGSEGTAGGVNTDGQKGPASSFQTHVETDNETASGTADRQVDLEEQRPLQREQEETRDDLSVVSDTEFPDFMDFDDELFTEDQRSGSPMLAEDFEARGPGVKEDYEDDFEEEGALENRESPNTEPDVQEISPSSAGGSDETEVLTSLEPGAGEADEYGVSQSRESDGGKDDGESGNRDNSGGGSQDKDKDQQEQDSQDQQESGEQSGDASLTGKASSATESKATGEQVGRQLSTSGEDQVETDDQNPGLQAGTDEQETRDRVQTDSGSPVMKSGQATENPDIGSNATPLGTKKKKASNKDRFSHVQSNGYGKQSPTPKTKATPQLTDRQRTEKKTTAARKPNRQVHSSGYGQQTTANKPKKTASTPASPDTEKKITAASKPNKQIKSSGYGQPTTASKSKKSASTPTSQGTKKKTTTASEPNRQVKSSGYGQQTTASKSRKPVSTPTRQGTEKKTTADSKPKKAGQSSSYGQETAASRAKKATPSTDSKDIGKKTPVQQTPPSGAKPKAKKPQTPAQRARIDKELERKDKELLGVSSIYNTADVKKMTLEKLLESATKPKKSRDVFGDSNKIIAAYKRHAIRNQGDTSPHYTGNTISNNIKAELSKLKLSETASRDEIAQALANSAIASFDQFKEDKNLVEHTKRLRALKDLKDSTFKI